MSTFQLETSRSLPVISIASADGDLLSTFKPHDEVLSASSSRLSLNNPHRTSSINLVSRSSSQMSLPKPTTSQHVRFGATETQSHSAHPPQPTSEPTNHSNPIDDKTIKQTQVFALCQQGLQLLTNEFKRLNRSNVYSQQFVICPVIKQFVNSTICTDFILAIIEYLDKWIVANADFEVLLAEYEMKADDESYFSDEQCFKDFLNACKYKQIITNHNKYYSSLLRRSHDNDDRSNATNNHVHNNTNTSVSTELANLQLATSQLDAFESEYNEAIVSDDDGNTHTSSSMNEADKIQQQTSNNNNNASSNANLTSLSQSSSSSTFLSGSQSSLLHPYDHDNDHHDNTNTNTGTIPNSQLTRARQAVYHRVHATVSRILSEATHPLKNLSHRHKAIRKRLLWLSESTRLLPKYIAVVGSMYYRVLSWRVAVTMQQNTGHRAYLKPPKGSSLRSFTDDLFYDNLCLLAEKVVELVYPTAWIKIRHEVTRIFRSHYFSVSIRKQRIMNNNNSSGNNDKRNAGSYAHHVNNGIANNNNNGVATRYLYGVVGTSNASTLLNKEYISMVDIGTYSPLLFLINSNPLHQVNAQTQQQHDNHAINGSSNTDINTSTDNNGNNIDPAQSESSNIMPANALNANIILNNVRNSNSPFPFAIPPIVISPKARHLELHHFYECEYRNEHHHINMTGLRNSNNSSSLTSNSNIQRKYSSTHYIDLHSPLLDVIMPSFSSLMHYQNSVLGVRAKKYAKKRQEANIRSMQEEMSTYNQLPAKREHVNHLPDEFNAISSKWNTQLRRDVAGKTGMYSEKYARNRSNLHNKHRDIGGGYNREMPTSELLSGIDENGNYVGIQPSNARDGADMFSFASFSSTSTFNVVGVDQPPRKLRDKMTSYNSQLEDTYSSMNTSDSTASLTSKPNVIDISNNLRTHFTDHIQQTLAFGGAEHHKSMNGTGSHSNLLHKNLMSRNASTVSMDFSTTSYLNEGINSHRDEEDESINQLIRQVAIKSNKLK